MKTLHLVDRLDRAVLDAPSPAHVEVQELDCGGAPRTGLFQHPDSQAIFPLELPLGGRLDFAVGVKRLAWERIGGPVRFRAGVRRAGEVIWVWERTLDPRTSAADRGWIAATTRLPRGDGVVLATDAQGGEHAWAGWADPTVQVRTLRRGSSRRRHPPRAPHLLVLTADALRADHVFGDETLTPNLDRLAAEGLSFAHTRTASLSTPASYGSLLSGVHAMRHGIVGEWGTLPPEFAVLPRGMAAAGYTTVFAPSERETGDPGQGFAPAFDETLACVGNPSQDGALTARRIVERLRAAAGEPLLIWGQFFDCHPPRRMPDELVRRHYEGDPRDPARAWQPERVAAVRGSEIVLHLEHALPALRAGRLDDRLTVRLRDTARTLSGELASGPDLAQHLVGLGLGHPALPRWLAEQAEALARGEIRAELVAWLEELRPQLVQVEREVLAWLDGVVDYRWPLAQVPAAAEHFDGHVGILLDALDELGLAADTTIVVTSPHGECFGEGGHHFTHHQPFEPSLRVPLLMRAPGFDPRRVEGVMELLDLTPTLLELFGLPVPGGLDGRSRLAALRAGAPLADRATFALAPDAIAACATRGSRKLVRTLAELPDARPGDQMWLDPEAGDAPTQPDPELEAELDAWLQSFSRGPGSRLGLALEALGGPAQ